MKTWFTSQLINISKQNRYRPDVSFPYNPLNGTLYVGSLVCESNVFTAYSNKIGKIGNALRLLDENSNVACVQSATSLQLKDESIDYIFIDPPFGANIMYSELNELWEGWLNVKTNNTQEAIINKVQGKELFDYQALMSRSFKEFYRVLKYDRWITIEFSNTSSSVWNSIQNSLQSVGFIVANVAALDKQQGSFNAVNSPTAVKQDLIISCFKPSNELIHKIETSADRTQNMWDFIEELLEHLPIHIVRGRSTTAVMERSPKILYDRLIAYYVQRNYPVPVDAAEFQAGLREHFVERDGMFFTVDQVIEYEDKKSQTEDFKPLSLFIGSESDGIQWLKSKLADGEKTYGELQPDWMRDMVDPKKGDNVPELSQILEENFLKNDKGQWRNPDPENEADLEQIRNKKLLAIFKEYVDAVAK